MTVKRLFVLLFFLSLFAISVRETTDPDMWWHLRTGEYILNQGIPRQDVFSYTATDHPWITHEWLSQLLMWGLYQAGGLPLLILFTAAITTLTFWLIYQCCLGQPYLAAFMTLLSAIASAIVWGARPQLFNLFFFALFIYLLERWRSQRLPDRALWFIPLVTILWANLHSGYLLGVVLLAVYAVGEALQRFASPGGSLPWAAIRRLALVTGLAFVAAGINPNGASLWLYPFATLGSGAMQSYIQEWHSPDFHLPIFWPFVGLMMFGVVGWVFSRQRPTWTELLLFLGAFAAGLLSARHIPIFALVAAPIVCRHWLPALAHTPLYPTLAGQRPDLKGLPVVNWLLVFAALLGVVGWTGQTILDNEETIASHFPVAAVDYLLAHDLAQARGYNSYGWGGYLIWRGLPVFVDGRADLYGDDFLRFYRQTLELQPNWAEPLDQFDVQYVLIERGAPLAALLAIHPEWQAVYTDDIAQIFTRTPTP